MTGTAPSGNAYGGDASGSSNAMNNTVIVNSSGSVGGAVIGGMALGSGNARNNTVIINGGLVGTNVAGGSSANDATGNSVTINGGTITGSVCGGVDGINATGNSVTISGGSIGDDIYGGQISENSTGNATNNSVTITTTGAIYKNIYGGDRKTGGSGTGGDLFTGNTLNLHVSSLTVTGVSNFQYLNFYLPSTLTAGATILTVTGTADLTDGAGRSSTVNVGIEGGSSPLQVGNQVVLIDAGTLTGAPANTTAKGMQGVTLLYEFDLLADSLNNQLLATVSSIGVNPQLKALSEGRAAGMAFVNQGSDLMLGSGMGAMLAATQGATGRGPAQGGFAPFAAGSGGWSRYNTGSHVDVSGVSIMTGLAWRKPVNEGKNGSFLAGAFFEAGWGGYDSHNSFSNAASVKGDGDISYYDGGILGRYDFAPSAILGGPGNFYVDASFRAGHVSTDFSSSDLVDNAGRTTDYDSGSAYYGAHAGVGYLWNITERASLDLSTRYIWTHQNSDTVKVLGDPVKFKASDSQRWRTGARFAYAVNECIAPYVGAYYDHEFDGKARASTNGYAIDAPDLTGGTGVGELGLTLKPSQTLPLTFDLGVQGYTGVREGVTGSLQAKWEF